MKKLAPFVAFILLALPFSLAAQVDNNIHVSSFPGSTVGAKVTAAMATCTTNATIPCILVIDPSLATWAPGSLPTMCSHCYLWDWRNGPPGVLPPTESIFVTSAPYNAKCDSHTDDTAAIQAAINDGVNLGYVIQFPGAEATECITTATLTAPSGFGLWMELNSSAIVYEPATGNDTKALDVSNLDAIAWISGKGILIAANKLAADGSSTSIYSNNGAQVYLQGPIFLGLDQTVVVDPVPYPFISVNVSSAFQEGQFVADDLATEGRVVLTSINAHLNSYTLINYGSDPVPLNYAFTLNSMYSFDVTNAYCNGFLVACFQLQNTMSILGPMNINANVTVPSGGYAVEYDTLMSTTGNIAWNTTGGGQFSNFGPFGIMATLNTNGGAQVDYVESPNFPDQAASDPEDCLQIDEQGDVTNSGAPCAGGGTSGNNSNGYWVKDTTGHIHQWGHLVAEGSSCNAITFPTAFTTLASIILTVSDDFGSGSSIEHSAVYALSHSCAAYTVNGFNDWISSIGAPNGGVWWTADGY